MDERKIRQSDTLSLGAHVQLEGFNGSFNKKNKTSHTGLLNLGYFIQVGDE